MPLRVDRLVVGDMGPEVTVIPNVRQSTYDLHTADRGLGSVLPNSWQRPTTEVNVVTQNPHVKIVTKAMGANRSLTSHTVDAIVVDVHSLLDSYGLYNKDTNVGYLILSGLKLYNPGANNMCGMIAMAARRTGNKVSCPVGTWKTLSEKLQVGDKEVLGVIACSTNRVDLSLGAIYHSWHFPPSVGLMNTLADMGEDGCLVFLPTTGFGRGKKNNSAFTTNHAFIKCEGGTQKDSSSIIVGCKHNIQPLGEGNNSFTFDTAIFPYGEVKFAFIPQFEEKDMKKWNMGIPALTSLELDAFWKIIGSCQNAFSYFGKWEGSSSWSEEMSSPVSSSWSEEMSSPVSSSEVISSPVSSSWSEEMSSPVSSSWSEEMSSPVSSSEVISSPVSSSWSEEMSSPVSSSEVVSSPVSSSEEMSSPTSPTFLEDFYFSNDVTNWGGEDLWDDSLPAGYETYEVKVYSGGAVFELPQYVITPRSWLSIEWGDGASDNYVYPYPYIINHMYGAGTYTIRVRGRCALTMDYNSFPLEKNEAKVTRMYCPSHSTFCGLDVQEGDRSAFTGLFCYKTQLVSIDWTMSEGFKSLLLRHWQRCGYVNLNGAVADDLSLVHIPTFLPDLLTSIKATKLPVSFGSMFSDCRALTDSVPELWNMFSGDRVDEHWSCFYNCTKAANYEEIPYDWKH